MALSTQSSVPLWHNVINRAPAACQTRSGERLFSSPTPPSTAMIDAILPIRFARTISAARVAGKNTFGCAALMRRVISICSSTLRAGGSISVGT